MKTHITGAAAVAALLLASPAAAQEGEHRPEVVAATAELIDRFTVMLEGLGADPAALSRDQFVRAVETALPLGETDGGSWASGMSFDFTTAISATELEPDAHGRTVLTDARACLDPDQVGEVVHFERITREGLRGHRCVVLFKGVTGGVWVLQSRTFAEGPGRRFSAHYGVGVSTGEDTDPARRMIEGRLLPNIRLSGAMAMEALDLFMLQPRDGGPVPATEAAVGITRLGERLDALATSGQDGEGQQ